MSRSTFTEDEIRTALRAIWTLPADDLIRRMRSARIDKQENAALAEMKAAAAASKEAVDNPLRETLEQRLSLHSAFMRAQDRFDKASKKLDRLHAARERFFEEEAGNVAAKGKVGR
jgi:hypothetical protein